MKVAYQDAAKNCLESWFHVSKLAAKTRREEHGHRQTEDSVCGSKAKNYTCSGS